MSTFNVITFYGYRITIPSDVNARDYIEDLFTLNSMIQPNFEICGIISTISSDVDYSDYDDYEHVHFILGFRPSNDVCLVESNGLTLEGYIHSEPVLDGIEFSSTPAFYSGIEWEMPERSDSGSDSDSDSASDTEDEDEDEESDSDSDSDLESESESESDEDDETTTCDNMNTK